MIAIHVEEVEVDEVQRTKPKPTCIPGHKYCCIHCLFVGKPLIIWQPLLPLLWTTSHATRSELCPFIHLILLHSMKRREKRRREKQGLLLVLLTTGRQLTQWKMQKHNCESFCIASLTGLFMPLLPQS